MKAAFFIALSVLALSACKKEDGAEATATAESAGFTWQGKPVDPMCFTMDSDKGIALADCSNGKGADETTTPEGGIETNENGSIGYTFKCEEGCMRQPYVSYKDLGVIDGAHAILVHTSGGGTGDFSTLGLYKVADDKLTRVKSLAGGDRCNGGIDDVHVKDGKVIYSQNITPFDLVEASGNAAGFKAYDDIAACAACCIGTSNFEDGTLVSVTLNQNPSEVTSEDLGPKDACFYGTYNETFMAGKTTLDAAALKAFGQTFTKRCGSLAGKALPPTIDSTP